jgi:hypothetical protein
MRTDMAARVFPGPVLMTTRGSGSTVIPPGVNCVRLGIAAGMRKRSWSSTSLKPGSGLGESTWIRPVKSGYPRAGCVGRSPRHRRRRRRQPPGPVFNRGDSGLRRQPAEPSSSVQRRLGTTEGRAGGCVLAGVVGRGPLTEKLPSCSERATATAAHPGMEVSGYEALSAKHSTTRRW